MRRDRYYRSVRERTPLLRRITEEPGAVIRGSISSALEGLRHDEEQPISKTRGGFIIASIGLLIFLQATNMSILTTTQSAIAADLDAFDNVTWLTSSYLIAMSSLAPLMGRLSQVFSPRLCMFISTVIIAAGTLIIATSTTFEMFIVGRVISGAGASGIFIVASIITIQMTSPERRGLFIGLVNTSMTAGVSLGAVIAGALESKVGWKPLFGVQSPLCLLAGLGLLLAIPVNYASQGNKHVQYTFKQKLARIDYSGALLLVVTIVLFLFALSGPSVLPYPLALSAFSLPLFVMNEIYVAKDPVIPVNVMRSRGTLLTCLATVGAMMARWAVLFYTPVYALAVREWVPAAAGSILIPTNAGFAAGGILAGVYHIKREGSFYAHSVISMALWPITMAFIALTSTTTSSMALYMLLVFLNGLITGAALNYTLVHLLHLTLPELHPIIISLLATFRGFAGSFGSAIGGGLFGRVLYRSLVDGFANAGLTHRDDLLRKLLGSPALVGQLEGAERDVAVGAYQDAIKALFFAATGLAVVVTLVQACTGWKKPLPKTKLDPEETIAGEEGAIGGI
ncbi:MFS general substrate transporter [Didymella exigua CBS 183.55]|uniref:MFS general substrate transporter n=1 Tax=Didymella exigua CBS 183.55 TaxID=1150837 RepID=A0A6A5RFN1_9PLEO|nr:MFS general substrate transporter [Didymella exigua CBS 183.55]KAF1926269.1 MFS general substrate transporter [Didymella exigua CBS 183.55]